MVIKNTKNNQEDKCPFSRISNEIINLEDK